MLNQLVSTADAPRRRMRRRKRPSPASAKRKRPRESLSVVAATSPFSSCSSIVAPAGGGASWPSIIPGCTSTSIARSSERKVSARSLAARAQRGKGTPGRGVARLGQGRGLERAVDGRLEEGRLAARQLASVQAEVAECLAARRRREPGPEAVGLADPIEVLDEAQPSRLGDIGRIRPREAERARRRPDETLEA